MEPAATDPAIRLGISSCLLGQKVRYDGGHKHDPYITQTLGHFFEFVPVCPELESGMGVPRPSLHLAGNPAAPRMVVTSTGEDKTEQMERWSVERLETLAPLGLCGYVLKRASPSCGMERVKVYASERGLSAPGRGLFAAALMRRFPLLPVEEEGRLHDMPLRENFIERVFAFFRWRQFVGSRPTAAGLVDFHARQKLTLLSHHRPSYQTLGRLVAEAGKRPMHMLLEAYGTEMMAGLGYLATRAKHTNVLEHMSGYFKKALDTTDRDELHDCIERYRRGLVPLVVPMTLLTHHLRRHEVPWLAQQTYLNPYPAELMLRNHV
jgi:uncharacterized protein YbgA (DUF1722 family)/uncharacterized protein YbbK (DUF523 family)